MRVREGCEAAFENAWLEAAATISMLSGNVRQDLVRDTDDTRTYLIISDWTDRTVLEAFGRSEQRDQLMAMIRDLRESAQRNTYELAYSVVGPAGRHLSSHVGGGLIGNPRSSGRAPGPGGQPRPQTPTTPGRPHRSPPRSGGT